MTIRLHDAQVVTPGFTRPAVKAAKTVVRRILLAAAFFAMPGIAIAQPCEATIEGNDAIRFSLSQIAVPAQCQQFTVHLKHVGKLPKLAMGHNWVLTRKEDMPGVMKEAMAVGASRDYLDPADPRIIAYTPAIGGGQQTSVTFPTSRLKSDEEYVFFCSYGAHHVLMQGLLQVVR